MKWNLRYKRRTLPVLRRRIEKLTANQAKLSRAGGRTWLLLQSEAEDLLEAFGIVPTKSTRTSPYWIAGPELATLEWSSQRELERWSLRRTDGDDLDPYQELLVLELQHEVLLFVESVQDSGDDILDLASGGFERFTIARFGMHLAGQAAWSNPDFWEGHILPSGVFNVRLLERLERHLSRTYENLPVNVGVLLVSEAAARRLNHDTRCFLDLELLEGDKDGLRLTDGKTTTFVYSFDGTFCGYHDVASAMAIAETVSPGEHFGWRVTAARTIEGWQNDCLRVVLSQGSWRYVDHESQHRTLVRKEPSLATHNQKIWDLCLALSQARVGALVLFVDKPDSLIEAEFCSPGELTDGAAAAIDASCGPRPEKPTLFAIEPIPARTSLLNQFNGVRVDSLSLDLLAGLARVDGALIISTTGELLGFGVILKAPASREHRDAGARTTAARTASSLGLAIKVSEDGPITAFFDKKRLF